MTDTSLYREVLMDHYRHPRNKGDLSNADLVRRGSNPRCGDDLEIGVCFAGDTLRRVCFHGRGCSVCMASASMMTEVVTGQSRQAVRELCDRMNAWTLGQTDQVPAELLQPLDAVRKHSARQRCVLLSWVALADAVS
ncbi:Fe-S cluster assembly sulfur transfer protein SufU [Saccharospirillum impatiens]|uniref:Fe-S cluster assembly sulfur transfer protein SufU n=1 Tax=Saccharospirillum impatiens TaxID=169438 RepID=UPI00146AFA76|nr:SUF system NifU family Fe-S cluster assembly protein [Saccharospirillum impatiens]